jgi:hypothetical protein
MVIKGSITHDKSASVIVPIARKKDAAEMEGSFT